MRRDRYHLKALKDEISSKEKRGTVLHQNSSRMPGDRYHLKALKDEISSKEKRGAVLHQNSSRDARRPIPFKSSKG
jgi:hypothetical protein